MFIGVLTCDRLPTWINADGHVLMICDTDPHDKPGKHWYALCIEDSSYGEYFDSFGKPPEAPFESFLNHHCTHWIFNDRQLENIISNFCGQYCIFLMYA